MTRQYTCCQHKPHNYRPTSVLQFDVVSIGRLITWHYN